MIPSSEKQALFEFHVANHHETFAPVHVTKYDVSKTLNWLGPWINFSPAPCLDLG